MDYISLNISGTIFRLHKNTFYRLPSHCFENLTPNSKKNNDGKETCEEYYLAIKMTIRVWRIYVDDTSNIKIWCRINYPFVMQY
jgi:hypothetical protein